jgi:hypothetical protein
MSATQSESDIIIKVMMEMQRNTAELTAQAKAAAEQAKKVWAKEFGGKMPGGFKDSFMSILGDKRAAEAKAAAQASKQGSMQDIFKMTKLDNLDPALLKTYQKNLAGLTTQYGKTVPMINLQNEALKRTQESVKDNPFKGWAMSIMFAGMAIKNTMAQLWTSSQKTFNEVMHSVEGTTTGFDMLDGSLKYLSFNMGAALEPLAMMLIPIVDYVSELVMDHPDAFKWLFAALTVLGTAAFAGGSIALAKAGVEGLALAFGLASKNAAGLITYDWAALGTTIQKGVGSVAILWSLKKADDAYDYFESGKFVESFTSALSGMAMASGGLLLWKGKNVAGGAAIALGIGLEWVEEDRFFQNAGWLMGWLVAGFATVMLRLKWSWNNGWQQMISDLIDMLSPVSMLLSAFGISIGKAIFKPQGEFDWSGSFETAMVEIMARMKEMDMALAEKKDIINQKVDSMVTPVQNSGINFDVPGMASQTVNNVTYNFVQQTGESNQAFINRIMAEIKAMQVK